jgi:pimeloyl-ACP methyl ester carboxylesterase
MPAPFESPALKTRTLSVGPHRIALHETSGEGPPVLLVHGNSSSARIWQQTMEGPLGQQLRLLAIDLPGHGASPDPAEAERAAAYSLPTYATLIEGVVRQLGLERLVVVGWSLGGHAVLEAVPALPDAAGFMVFGTPPLPYPPAPDFGGAFLKIGLGFQKDWTAAQGREYVADFFVPGSAAPAVILEDALRTDGNAREMAAVSIGTVGYRDEVALARDMTQPLAILHGAHEQIVNLAYIESLAAAMPTLWERKVHVIEGAGHALQWEQPARFDERLAAFVAFCRSR